MPDLPIGIVTLLLTEVEDSVRRWEADPAGMPGTVARLDRIVDQVLATRRGMLVKPRGEGDSHFAVFADPADAVEAAAELMATTQGDAVLAAAGVRIRAAVHTGEMELRDGDYYGPNVNRCARLRAIARGGQVLVTGTAAEAARARITGVALRDLGRHYLKDLARPEQVFQVVGPLLPNDFAPLVSAPPPGHGLPLPVTSFIGRDAELRALTEGGEPGRVLCVTGAPGVGKSRLALEATAAMHDDGLSARYALAGEPAFAGISRAAGSGDVLLIDDADHHLDDVARVAADAASRGAAVVVTSRTSPPTAEPFRLPPLPTGVGGPSMRLFADRAAAVRADFDLGGGDDLIAVDQLLGGLPLAIELAAARLSVLTVGQIATRLVDPRRVLGGPARREPARHHSLEAAVAWTAGNLGDPASRALAGLAAGLLDPKSIDDAVLTDLAERSWIEPDEDSYRVLPVLRPFLASLADP